MSRAELPTDRIDGTCDIRFAAVRDAFAENFADRDEVGACVAVSVDGRLVVDLWAGHTDPERTVPWAHDTLVNVYSVGKGFLAVCIHRLVERGALDLDAPVARMWPEFAAAGKDRIRVSDLVSHTAGLPAVRPQLPRGTMLDWNAMTAALARESPWWEPGTGHGYHVNTFGFLVGEVIRRTTGRTVGQFLREEVAGPFGVDFHIGLPRDQHARVAHFGPRTMGQAHEPDDVALATLDHAALMRFKAYSNPIDVSGGGVLNTAAWRSAEIPATNGHANARAIARMYGLLATGDARMLAASTIELATVEHAAGLDLVLQRPSRFGLGFQLTQPERPLGPNPRAFGHFGAGGSLGFADPDARVGFGYAMNRMGERWRDPRNRAVVDALYCCL